MQEPMLDGRPFPGPETPDLVRLDAAHALRRLRLPGELRPDLDALWALHPDEYHRITMYGREVETPRWQQAYGADYRYTGRVNRALPAPAMLAPLLAWTQAAFDARLNGLLLNWYDAEHAHYIGKHRDSTAGLVEGAPIVTISLGAERVFRLRPWRVDGAAPIDVPVPDGTVLVMGWATNLAFTHEVPFRPSKDAGRRISVTVRAFDRGVLD